MEIMETKQTVSTARPWDTVAVARWQLDRLMDGLGQIVRVLDAVKLGDRMDVAGAVGFASGSALALTMLVESMKDEEVRHHELT